MHENTWNRDILSGDRHDFLHENRATASSTATISRSSGRKMQQGRDNSGGEQPSVFRVALRDAQGWAYDEIAPLFKAARTGSLSAVFPQVVRPSAAAMSLIITGPCHYV